MNSFRCCAVVPTFDNPLTVGPVVERIREQLANIFVVDDGSATPAREACAASAGEPGVRHLRLDVNRGKGAAVKAGLAAAQRAGFSHAFQIDADGQHDLSRIPAFLEAARSAPDAVVLGYPIYDDSLPRLRRFSRQITRFWVDLEVGGAGIVQDAMIGFRVYPIEAILALEIPSDRMAFDVECAVLACWAGIPIVNRPVGVRYPSEAEGGVSHFQPVRDNLRLSWMHSRLCSRAATLWSLERLGLIRARDGSKARSTSEAPIPRDGQ